MRPRGGGVTFLSSVRYGPLGIMSSTWRTMRIDSRISLRRMAWRWKASPYVPTTTSKSTWSECEQGVVLVEARRQHVEDVQHVVAPPVGQVGCGTARTDEVVVHAQAGDLLE